MSRVSLSKGIKHPVRERFSPLALGSTRTLSGNWKGKGNAKDELARRRVHRVIGRRKRLRFGTVRRGERGSENDAMSGIHTPFLHNPPTGTGNRSPGSGT